jgi:hypothetical protein
MMTALIMNAGDGDTIPNLIWEDVQENTQPFALIVYGHRDQTVTGEGYACGMNHNRSPWSSGARRSNSDELNPSTCSTLYSSRRRDVRNVFIS